MISLSIVLSWDRTALRAGSSENYTKLSGASIPRTACCNDVHYTGSYRQLCYPSSLDTGRVSNEYWSLRSNLSPFGIATVRYPGL
jgi:hypothetical protein